VRVSPDVEANQEGKLSSIWGNSTLGSLCVIGFLAYMGTELLFDGMSCVRRGSYRGLDHGVLLEHSPREAPDNLPGLCRLLAHGCGWSSALRPYRATVGQCQAFATRGP